MSDRRWVAAATWSVGAHLLPRRRRLCGVRALRRARAGARLHAPAANPPSTTKGRIHVSILAVDRRRRYRPRGSRSDDWQRRCALRAQRHRAVGCRPCGPGCGPRLEHHRAHDGARSRAREVPTRELRVYVATSRLRSTTRSRRSAAATSRTTTSQVPCRRGEHRSRQRSPRRRTPLSRTTSRPSRPRSRRPTRHTWPAFPRRDRRRASRSGRQRPTTSSPSARVTGGTR